jgi:hypothetical protein
MLSAPGRPSRGLWNPGRHFVALTSSLLSRSISEWAGPEGQALKPGTPCSPYVKTGFSLQPRGVFPSWRTALRMERGLVLALGT